MSAPRSRPKLSERVELLARGVELWRLSGDPRLELLAERFQAWHEAGAEHSTLAAALEVKPTAGERSYASALLLGERDCELREAAKHFADARTMYQAWKLYAKTAWTRERVMDASPKPAPYCHLWRAMKLDSRIFSLERLRQILREEK